MNIIFNKFGWIIPLLWYPAKLASDFIIDKSEWLRYDIEHSFALELILMSVFILIIEKLTHKKVAKIISNENELFFEEKNRLLKLDFLWWSIIFSSISGIIGLYNLLKYIEDNYTKAEFGMLLIFLSTVILIFAIRKKYLAYKKSKNIELIQDELKKVYENNQIKIANRYNKNEIAVRIASIISFISMASILLQGLIGISYFTLALLLYYTRLRAIANDELLEYATINFVLLTVSIFIFRYFFIHRELASLYYFIYPIICFSVYCWRYKRYTLLNEKIEVI